MKPRHIVITAGATITTSFAFAFFVSSLLSHLPELAIIPDGCEVMHTSTTRCEVYEGRSTLRVWVDAQSDANLWILDNFRFVPFETLPTDQGQLVELTPRAGSRTLTIVASHGRSLSRVQLSIVDWQVPEWLLEARRAYETNNDVAADRILKEHETSPVAPGDRAQATSLRGKLEYQAGRFESAAQWFARAVEEDRIAGLASREAQDTLWRARVLGQKMFHYKEAENLLVHCSACDQLPDLLGWRNLQLALYRLMRGDIRNAVTALDHTEQWAARFHNDYMLSEVAIRRADMYSLWGRSTEAQKELDRISDSSLPNCRRAIVLQKQGLLRLDRLALQSEPSQLHSESNPVPLLETALLLRRRECTQQREIADILFALGDAALLRGDTDSAYRRLAELQAETSADDPIVHAQSVSLEGRILLAAKQWSEAETVFRRLLDHLRTNLRSEILEPFWEAWMGMAQSYEGQSRFADALAAYRQAERYLDARAREMPLDGRSKFVGRHERGTALYVDLLVRRGASEPPLLDEALRVVRRSRIRGILELSSLVDNAKRSDTEREAMRRALVEYRAIRMKIENLHMLAADADRIEENRLLTKAKALENSLVGLFPKALGLGQDESAALFAPPLPNELLLACHPMRREWICLAATTDTVQAIPIPSLHYSDWQQTKTVLEQHLIRPLARRLAEKKRLRYIADGVMNTVGIESLSLNGRPLEADHEIVWSLDVPGIVSESRLISSTRRALFVIDPAGEIGISNAFDVIKSSLADYEYPRWLVDARVGPSPWEAPSFVTQQRDRIPLGIDLPELVRGTDLFVYYGHSEMNAYASLRHGLRAGPVTLLAISDALLLEEPPRRAILLGCNTGNTDLEAGGVEGFGMAQALLLRGSQMAIATTKEFHFDVGRRLLVALFRSGMEKPDGDPVQALRVARQMVRAEWVKDGGAPDDPRLLDLEAVHVFVR